MTPVQQAEPGGRIGHEAGTFDTDVPSPGEATPRRPDHVSEIDWTRAMPESPEREGREQIEGAPEFGRMRRVAQRLDVATREFAEKIRLVEDDPDLTGNGKAKRLEPLREQLERAIADEIKDFETAEGVLRNRFANSAPVPKPITTGTADRILVALNQLDRLSPARGIALLERYVSAGDEVIVQELLDVFEDYAERRSDYVEYLKDVPITANPIRSVVDRGRGLLIGSSNYGARYLTTIAPKLRSELELVVRTIRDEGRWVGSQVQRTEGEQHGAKRRALTWLIDGTEE